MKKDRFNFKVMALALVVPMLFVACDDIGSNLDPIPGYEYETVSPQAIAEAVAYIHPDKEICEEVHSAVRSAVALGLDESYYFAEAFGVNDRITKTSKVKRSLQSKIKSLSVGNSIKEILTLVADDSQYMDHYQIYWPYSDRWDGNTMPTITFQSKAAVPQEEGIGYRILNDRVEEVTVNEEYAKEHPVWIINYNPIPYEEYPDFAVRNWTHEDKMTVTTSSEFDVCERIIYYANAFIKGSKKDFKLPDYVDSLQKIDFEKDALSLYLKNVRLDFNEESKSLFSGGIHYVFNIGVNDEADADDLNALLNNPRELEGEIVSVRFTLLRSEIKSGIDVSLHTLLSWNWQSVEEFSSYKLLQEIERIESKIDTVDIGYSDGIVVVHDSEQYLTNTGNKTLTCSTVCRTTLEKSTSFQPNGYNVLIPVEFGVTKGTTTPSWHIQTTN